MTNRKERRANPDDWFELTGFAFQQDAVISIPEEYRQFVRGSIGNLLIVEVPTSSLNQRQTVEFMRDVQKSLASVGLEVLVVQEGTKFLSARLCSPEKSKRLERDRRLKEVSREIEDQKAREKETKPS